MEERNFGILASVDWNSRHWIDQSSEEDMHQSKYGYMIENDLTFTVLNFGHEKYPADDQGYYYGLLPQLWTNLPDKVRARYVEVVFIKSYNWHDKMNYIVGFYAFPVFGRWIRPSPLESFKQNFELNVKAFPKDIHRPEHYINISDPEIQKSILPKGKLLGKQGYNYLTKENVFKILDLMSALNPDDTKLKTLKYRLIQSIGSKG